MEAVVLAAASAGDIPVEAEALAGAPAAVLAALDAPAIASGVGVPMSATVGSVILAVDSMAGILEGAIEEADEAEPAAFPQ